MLGAEVPARIVRGCLAVSFGKTKRQKLAQLFHPLVHHPRPSGIKKVDSSANIALSVTLRGAKALN